jgi:hypothetical protein
LNPFTVDKEAKDHIVIHSEDGMDVVAFGPMTEHQAINFTNKQPYFRREVELKLPGVADWRER